MKDDIQEIITYSSKTITSISNNLSEIESIVLKIISAIKNGNKIILFGNGASASISSHVSVK